MKAIVQDEYGTAEDVPRLQEIDPPAIGDDEVLVRVRAAGVDRSVWHFVTGLPYPVRLAGYGIRAPKNRVPGSDLAGRVDATGRAVTRLRTADAVFGFGAGSFAEMARTREDLLAPKPENLSFEQAAAVPVSGLTACRVFATGHGYSRGSGVLVLLLVRREQGTLRWVVLREALWLRAPRNPRTGRRGGRTWLVLVPLVALFWAEEYLPELPHDPRLDLRTFLESTDGYALLAGGWGWFAVLVVMCLFNTVLGEELLFRGYLLPRMAGAFGRWDWLANGVLFAGYHVHAWWGIPRILVDALVLSWPARRYRSALLGIVVHSAQSVVLVALVLPVVLQG